VAVLYKKFFSAIFVSINAVISLADILLLTKVLPSSEAAVTVIFFTCAFIGTLGFSLLRRDAKRLRLFSFSFGASAALSVAALVVFILASSGK